MNAAVTFGFYVYYSAILEKQRLDKKHKIVNFYPGNIQKMQVYLHLNLEAITILSSAGGCSQCGVYVYVSLPLPSPPCGGFILFSSFADAGSLSDICEQRTG